MGRSHLASSNWYLEAVIDSLGTGYTKCYNTFSCLCTGKPAMNFILVSVCQKQLGFFPLFSLTFSSPRDFQIHGLLLHLFYKLGTENILTPGTHHKIFFILRMALILI